MAVITIAGIGSPTDFALSATVDVSAAPATGSTYLWEFLDKPEGSSASFASPTAQATSFTADVYGTYLIQVTIDGNDIARAIAAAPVYGAFPFDTTALRAPAAGEQLEANLVTGWARAIQALYNFVASIALFFQVEPRSMQQPGLVTSSDGDQAITLALYGAVVGGIMVFVNGVGRTIGQSGDFATKVCYFSDDGGTTAKDFNNIQQGDTLHWNGSVATFELAVTDVIDILYVSAV